MRSSDHYLHGVISSDSLCGNKSLCIDEVVKVVAEKVELSEFKPAQLRDIEKELLRIDEVRILVFIVFPPPFFLIASKLAVCNRKQVEFVAIQNPQVLQSLESEPCCVCGNVNSVRVLSWRL